MAIGRDQVALLCLYVLTGYVLAYWLTGKGRSRSRTGELRAALGRHHEPAQW